MKLDTTAALRPIAPVRHALVGGLVRVPASKSLANRELVLSAIASGKSRLDIGDIDPGDDVHAMADALASLGHEVRWSDGHIEITPREAPAQAEIAAHEAGTVARFVAALAATTSASVRIDGSERMRERPMRSLTEALRALGASVEGDGLPITVRGPLAGGEVAIPASESSQFASALLLVAPRMERGLRLRLVGDIVSAPFLEMTAMALRRRGVRVDRPSPREFVVAPSSVGRRSVTIPGDVTAATYPAAAVALLGGTLTIANACARHEEGGQGDVRFFDLIEDMGCGVKRASTSTSVRRVGDLYGITANVSDCSDTFPTLAIIATQARTPTELDGLGHTRRQESDRLAAVAAGINALGGQAQLFGDAIRIEPRPLHEGVVDAQGDHRIAMAFAVLGLLVPGVAISGADSVAKTFPSFFEMLEGIGR